MVAGRKNREFRRTLTQEIRGKVRGAGDQPVTLIPKSRRAYARQCVQQNGRSSAHLY